LKTGRYGVQFWKEQLKHIQETGQPRINVPKSAVNRRLSIGWLKPDAEVVWVSQTGLKRVRILFVGNHEVMVKIIGEPIAQYDPPVFPNGNTWTTLEKLRPGTQTYMGHIQLPQHDANIME
jgi:hypothetical protein